MLLESATVGLAVLWLAQAPTPAPLTLSEALQRAAVSSPSLAAADTVTTLKPAVKLARTDEKRNALRLPPSCDFASCPERSSRPPLRTRLTS